MRGREQVDQCARGDHAASAASSLRKLRGGDSAVSPVVGMILVLAISIVGIAAILYWGLPAIDEMKASVEHRSLETQFQELDATIKELVAGTTERTAKRWQPTLNRGSVVMANETEGWVYAVEPYVPGGKAHSFVYGELGDGNHSLWISSRNESFTGKVQAYRVNGTTSEELLKVSRTFNGAEMTDEAWVTGQAKMLYLRDAGDNIVNIRNATIRFLVWETVAPDPTYLVGEAWFVPTGRVEYRLDAGLGAKVVIQNNGAVITGNGESYALVNSPPMPPAAITSGTARHFARAVVLNGTGSFAGDDRFDVLVTLYSTIALKSYDCAQADRTDCVQSAKIFVYGGLQDTWYQYLLTHGGYTFEEFEENGQRYLDDRDTWMGYTLLQSTVQMVGS